MKRNKDVAKVALMVERNMSNGGSRPVLDPNSKCR